MKLAALDAVHGRAADNLEMTAFDVAQVFEVASGLLAAYAYEGRLFQHGVDEVFGSLVVGVAFGEVAAKGNGNANAYDHARNGELAHQCGKVVHVDYAGGSEHVGEGKDEHTAVLVDPSRLAGCGLVAVGNELRVFRGHEGSEEPVGVHEVADVVADEVLAEYLLGTQGFQGSVSCADEYLFHKEPFARDNLGGAVRSFRAPRLFLGLRQVFSRSLLLCILQPLDIASKAALPLNCFVYPVEGSQNRMTQPIRIRSPQLEFLLFPFCLSLQKSLFAGFQ